jgi:hypothetical protein
LREGRGGRRRAAHAVRAPETTAWVIAVDYRVDGVRGGGSRLRPTKLLDEVDERLNAAIKVLVSNELSSTFQRVNPVILITMVQEIRIVIVPKEKIPMKKITRYRHKS